MSRQRFVIAFVAFYFVPAMSHAKDVREQIPGDALGYVVINRLADTDAKIQAIGQQMTLPIPDLVSLVKTTSGIAEGIDEGGSIAVAFISDADGPTAVLYVPVDDYPAFIEQLEPEGTEHNITTVRLVGRSVIVGKKNGHAVVAWPNNRTLLQKVLSDNASGQDTSDIAKSLQGDYEVEAVLSGKGIEVLTALGQKGLQEAKEMLRQQDEDNPALAGLEVYVQLLKAVGSEVSAFAGGLQLEEGGALRVDEWMWLQPTGKIAPLLQDVKPHSGDLLSGLPKIPYVIAFGGVLPSGAVEPMMDFSRNMMKAMPQLYGLTPEQVDTVMDLAVKYFPDLRGMSFLLGVGRKDAPLYSEMIGAMQVDDAKGYVTNYRKYWAEVQDAIGEAEGSFLAGVELEDLEINGVPALKLSMPIPRLDGLKLPNPDKLDALMEKLYGPGGITVYLAAADDHTVLMGYTEAEILRKGLEAATNKSQQISQDQNIAITSKQLPSGAHMAGYWSLGGTVDFANRMIQLVSGPEADIQLPGIPDAPPAGWAVTATPTVLKFNTVIPAETLEALARIIRNPTR